MEEEQFKVKSEKDYMFLVAEKGIINRTELSQVGFWSVLMSLLYSSYQKET